jgi:hypothetical protein
MKTLALVTIAALSLGATTASAQSTVRVQPGQVCADNKCVRFANDLRSVCIQARRSASVASLGLQRNPNISIRTFREIYALALRQGTRGPSR